MSGHEMGTASPRFGSVRDLLRWCKAAPDGTRLDAREVAQLLDELDDQGDEKGGETAPESPAESLSWRSKLWLVPAETRIGVEEVAEALDRPKSFVYRHTKSDAEDPLPHAKLGGSLRFKVGEVRTWIRETEQVEAAMPMTSTASERRQFGVVQSREEGAA